MKQNYIDEKGVYHNELNLTLAQIYDSGVDFGRSVAKAEIKAELEKIKEEIKTYELDCKLVGGPSECEQCDANVFGSIYRIIDRHIKGNGDKNNIATPTQKRWDDNFIDDGR